MTRSVRSKYTDIGVVPFWKSVNKNDRDQVSWARETEYPTQTLVFTKTAGRHNLVEVVVNSAERELKVRAAQKCSRVAFGCLEVASECPEVASELVRDI